MKPIYQLLLMLLVSCIAILIKEFLFNQKTFNIAFSLGQALVPFAFAAIIVLIGFILHWINRPKWTTTFRVAWVMLTVGLFFMYYADISM